MAMLGLGVFLFASVHLFPALAPQARAGILDRVGPGVYRAGFSLLLVTALALIIFGWRGIEPVFIYVPAAAMRLPAILILVLAFFLMAASSRNSRLCQWVRHPQLTGVLLWALAHLAMNGDSRSTVLFGGMALWAGTEILAINRRDGAWIKGAIPGWGAELVTLAIALVMVSVLAFIHPWISGMPVTW
jgi:uncharacterized membrane protein